MSTILIFIFGLCIGSFLNVVILRLHAGRSLGGFSECTHCHHRLAAFDLVPLFSFLILRGRCRYCGTKISWQYPLIEFATGVLFCLTALTFYQNHQGFEQLVMLVYELVIVCLLIVIFAFDWKYYLIPDRIVLLGIVVAIISRLNSDSFLEGLGGAVVMCGLFGGLYLISSGRWIGLGDVKLGIFLGILSGFSGSLIVLLLSYVSGAIVGVAMILLGQRTMKGILPFGTFLTAAAFLVMIWGDRILEWYRMNLYL